MSADKGNWGIIMKVGGILQRACEHNYKHRHTEGRGGREEVIVRMIQN